MKTKLFLIFFLFYTGIGFAQSKPGNSDKPPTQKEMDEMMKEMENAANEISPEDKKMMDSMGIKMPDTKAVRKSMEGITDAQLKKAYDDGNRIVPSRDEKRINAALAINLSNTALSNYIINTHEAVLRRLPASDKTKSNVVFQQVRTLKSSPANTAIGFWINGQPTVALFLMGEACKADPSNSVLLNNYASFLTMCGAEQLALPILYNLNKRYPRNSSILNNIAQAWLGLGDITRAEKYADSSIRIYAHHPQANMAKCLIEESKGNIPAAKDAAIKAIHKLYSTEKETKLKKLGHVLKSEDLNWDRPMPQDALGLGKFNWPEYPMNVDQNKTLEKDWTVFKEECEQQISDLKQKQQSLEKATIDSNEKRTKRFISESQKGNNVQVMPGYTAKAVAKLGPGVNDVNGNTSFVYANELEKIVNALKDVADYDDALSQKQKVLDKKYENQIGEGKSNPLDAICKDENQIRSEFLTAANGKLQAAYRSYFNYARRKTTDLLYYYQYTQWPDQFELAKVNAQITWLTMIKDQRVFFKDKSSWCELSPKPSKPVQLQKFDDVHCDYVSTTNMGVYKITSSCSNLIGEFDFGGVKIDYRSNVETGKYSGSAMVGTSKGFDGPAGIELEASIAALVEWDNTGLTDYGGIAGLSANGSGQTFAGSDLKITVNSGVSLSGKGILQGL